MFSSRARVVIATIALGCAVAPPVRSQGAPPPTPEEDAAALAAELGLGPPVAPKGSPVEVAPADGSSDGGARESGARKSGARQGGVSAEPSGVASEPKPAPIHAPHTRAPGETRWLRWDHGDIGPLARALGYGTLEAWTLPDLQPPSSVMRAPGRFAVSTRLLAFLDDPTLSGRLPAPSDRVEEIWTSRRPQQAPQQAGYIVLQYPGGVPDEVYERLRRLLWGHDEWPTERHPENILRAGEFLAVLSFAADDPLGDWLRDQLRERLRVKLLHTFPHLRPVLDELRKAYIERDTYTGYTVFDDHADELEKASLPVFWLGEFASWERDWKYAEASYRYATRMHVERVDPISRDPLVLWEAYDGFAVALLKQGKHAEAAGALRRCVAYAHFAEDSAKEAKSAFYLARSLCTLGLLPPSLDALELSLALDDEYLGRALLEAEFAPLRAQHDLTKLIGG